MHGVAAWPVAEMVVEKTSFIARLNVVGILSHDRAIRRKSFANLDL